MPTRQLRIAYSPDRRNPRPRRICNCRWTQTQGMPFWRPERWLFRCSGAAARTRRASGPATVNLPGAAVEPLLLQPGVAWGRAAGRAKLGDGKRHQVGRWLRECLESDNLLPEEQAVRSAQPDSVRLHSRPLDIPFRTLSISNSWHVPVATSVRRAMCPVPDEGEASARSDVRPHGQSCRSAQIGGLRRHRRSATLPAPGAARAGGLGRGHVPWQEATSARAR
jgi:hypothetical protein